MRWLTFCKDRTLQTALLAMILVLFHAYCNQLMTTHSGIHPKRFWVLKYNNQQIYNMVIGGDSRIYCGISPQALQSELDDWRIYNFGFSGLGYSEAYLNFLSDHVVKAPASSAVLLGITAHSLTPDAAEDNGFLNEVRRDRFESIVIQTIPFFSALIETSRLREWLFFSNLEQVYHEDGWVASRKYPINIMESVDLYRARHEAMTPSRMVSPAIVAQVMKKTQEWILSDTQVFAFAPPVPVQMRDVEREYIHFDAVQFKKDFTAAGGVWIETDPDAFQTYDGSHLIKEEAVRFSQVLGQNIAAHIGPVSHP